MEMLPSLAPSARILATGSNAGEAVKWTVDAAKMNEATSLGTTGFTQYAASKCLLHQQMAALSARLDAAVSASAALEEHHEGAATAAKPTLAQVHCCVWNPGAVKSSIGNNVSPLMAAVVKTLLAFVFRTPRTAAVIGLHAATVSPPVHGMYVSPSSEMGNPKKFETPKPLPGASDAAVCAAAFDAVETLIVRALGNDIFKTKM